MFRLGLASKLVTRRIERTNFSRARRRAPIDRDELNVVYAIVKTGGRQEKVSVGSIVVTNRIDGEAGDKVELEPIMLVDGDKILSLIHI